MKGFLALFALLIALCVFSSVTSSQSAQSYWHTQDGYFVELDGEGDAFVVATITLEGMRPDTYISSVAFEVPSRSVTVYKIIQTPSMINYRAYSSQSQAEFLEYSISRLSSSTMLAIQLKNPLIGTNQTSISIIYQANDIAKPSFQGLDFKFETMKDSQAVIRKSGVNIYVPQNMELKGKPKMSVSYLPSLMATYASSASATDMSRYISDYYPYYTTYQYSASNLDPSESMKVTGIYGENRFLLYSTEIIATIIIIMVVVILAKIFHAGGIIANLLKPKQAPGSRAPSRAQYAASQPIRAEFSLARCIFMGMISGASYVVVAYLFQFVQTIFTYGGYNYQVMLPLILLLIVLFYVVLPIVTLTLPAFILYKRFGWKEGLSTLILGILFALLFLFIIVLLFSGIQTAYYS